MVDCLHLSDGLGFDIGGLPSYSVPLCYKLCLSPLYFYFYGIVTGNETGSPSGVLVASFDLCGTIIYSLNCSPRSPLTKAFFLVIIEAIIFLQELP